MKKLENVEPKFAQQKSNFDKARLQQDNREKTAQLVDANYYRKGF